MKLFRINVVNYCQLMYQDDYPMPTTGININQKIHGMISVGGSAVSACLLVFVIIVDK